MWKPISEKSSEASLELQDADGFWAAWVKWDGCIELTRAFNIPLGQEADAPKHQIMRDHIHICDLDEYISRLQLLRVEAMQHFKGDWPG